jgi:hypothetical protein
MRKPSGIISIVLLAVFLLFGGYAYCQETEEPKQIEMEKIKLSVYHSSGNYTFNRSADITSYYLIYRLPNSAKVWAGFSNQQGPWAGFSQDLFTMGTYFLINNKTGLLLDYYSLKDSTNANASIYDAEVFYQFSKSFTGSVQYASSNYPQAAITQISPKAILYLGPKVTSVTKGYFTQSSAAGTPSYSAISQKFIFGLGSGFYLNVAGATGTRLSPVENDVSVIYNANQTLERNFQVGLSWASKSPLEAMVQYNRDTYTTYSADWYTAGIRYRF